MNCRLDKYVWCVRLAKTRSQASELIARGKIKINGIEVKPSREIKANDIIGVVKHNALFQYKVLEVVDKRLGPKLVDQYLADQTPPEEIEKLRLYIAAQRVYRENGSGKPSKKDRRDLDEFLEW